MRSAPNPTSAERWLRPAQWLWRKLPFRVRRRALLMGNDHFLVGVIGLIRDDDNRVLILRHRFRTPRALGLPGGFVHHGEALTDALIREIREETGLTIQVEPEPFDTDLNVHTRALSVTFLARVTSPRVTGPGDNGTLHIMRLSREIVSGGFYTEADMPHEICPNHLQIMRRYWARCRAGARTTKPL